MRHFHTRSLDHSRRVRTSGAPYSTSSPPHPWARRNCRWAEVACRGPAVHRTLLTFPERAFGPPAGILARQTAFWSLQYRLSSLTGWTGSAFCTAVPYLAGPRLLSSVGPWARGRALLLKAHPTQACDRIPSARLWALMSERRLYQKTSRPRLPVPVLVTARAGDGWRKLWVWAYARHPAGANFAGGMEATIPTPRRGRCAGDCFL